MQFLVIAFDHADLDASERRQDARAEHLKLGDEMMKHGELLYAAAILNETNQMMGSMMVVQFPARPDLDVWLKIEPYVIKKVWDKIDIRPCKPGPKFLN